jgi:hypothetical protein
VRSFPTDPAWVRLPFVACVVVAAAYVVDLVAEIDGSARVVLRVLVIAAAAVVAGTFFQRWSTVPERTTPHHVMAALGLLGGALVASSAFSTAPGVFGNLATASLGLVALWVSLLAARTTSRPTEIDR